MLIPINNLYRFGTLIGSTYYDNASRKTVEGELVDVKLPELDIMSYQLSYSDIATIVAKDYSNGNIIISFGDSHLYSIRMCDLDRFKISNTPILTVSLPDYGDYFEDKDLVFSNVLRKEQFSSIGLARKFYATKNDNLYVCKFKCITDKELEYEKLYYLIGSKFNIDVCECFLTSYNGKLCSCSKIQYDYGVDRFTSFTHLDKSTGEIYSSLCKEDQDKLDKYLILDYLMSQADRHMSNIALCNDRLYPLYDNGRCLGSSVGYYSEGYRKYVKNMGISKIRKLVDIEGICEYVRDLGYVEEYPIVKKNKEELLNA